MPRLIIQRAEEEARMFELPESHPVPVGRGEINSLILQDSSVSRRHATFLPTRSGGWRIVDLNSANGIGVNGVLVPEATLKNNDTIALGVYTLRFEAPESRPLVVHTPTNMPTRLTQMLKSQQPPTSMIRDTTPARRFGQTLTPPGAPSLPRGIEQRLNSLEHENGLLTLLYNVSRALAALGTIEEVVERVQDLALQIEGAERGCAMLLDERGNFLPALVRYRNSRPSDHGPQMILSQNIIRQVMEQRLPLVVQDAQADARFRSSESLTLAGVQSAMCAPLTSHDRIHGLLYVDNLNMSSVFSQEDLNVFAVIAAQAGLSIDHARARQEVAQRMIQQAALERFLSPGVARKIVAEAGNLCLGGETQELTVLFSDIRGFTHLAESLPPTKVVEILNHYFEGMAELVFRHEGTLDKFLGDGLMSLFGAPLAQEQNALRAVQTAIEMQALAQKMRRESGELPLSIGIGINTGPAVAGYIGAARRLDYTAIGDTVNVAARLTEQAEPDQILISSSTCNELAGQLPVRRLEPRKLKGKLDPVEVHEVMWREALPLTVAAG
jgi:adenylate cyclase